MVRQEGLHCSRRLRCGWGTGVVVQVDPVRAGLSHCRTILVGTGRAQPRNIPAWRAVSTGWCRPVLGRALPSDAHHTYVVRTSDAGRVAGIGPSPHSVLTWVGLPAEDVDSCHEDP